MTRDPRARWNDREPEDDALRRSSGARHPTPQRRLSTSRAHPGGAHGVAASGRAGGGRAPRRGLRGVLQRWATRWTIHRSACLGKDDQERLHATAAHDARTRGPPLPSSNGVAMAGHRRRCSDDRGDGGAGPPTSIAVHCTICRPCCSSRSRLLVSIRTRISCGAGRGVRKRPISRMPSSLTHRMTSPRPHDA